MAAENDAEKGVSPQRPVKTRLWMVLMALALLRPCATIYHFFGGLALGTPFRYVFHVWENLVWGVFLELHHSWVFQYVCPFPVWALCVVCAYWYVKRRLYQRKALTIALLGIVALMNVFVIQVEVKFVEAGSPEDLALRRQRAEELARLRFDESSAGECAMPSWKHCDFATRLYRSSAPKSPEENFVVSPCGVASGLALMGSGSGGDTAKEFRRALSMQEALNCDIEQVRGDFRDIAAFQASALRAASDGQSHVETDNALWLAPDVKMDRRFEGAAEFFGAEKLKGDAKKAIAGFVAEKTRGTGLGSAIPEVDPLARMIAVNAVRFSGVWQRPFRRIETYARPFKAPGGEVSVPFMHSLMTAELCECDGAKALRLPYKNGKFEMVFVLPPEDQSLAWLEGRLDSDFFGRLLASARMMDDVDVALPKFEIECSLSLKGALAAMGLENAFADGADFSAIAREPLFLSDVEQSAVLRVDEAGTEAAAATKVTALCAAAGMISFEACRPFLFVLREKAHGIVLFIGRVATPRSRQGA